ncbi:conserved membrane hypothetical protein [Capnocytophaga cynodegmi]|uniref:Uncharacterized protein n=1 Tax=Capnocytophaga cynodegmi TaxID=28189 RepID=A0A0B7HR33_9FLAO|nr:conserved membrane hypothetical protein [Capnocytophaga cynodegmi]
MLKYYYTLWVDAVLFIRKKKKNKDIFYPLVIMVPPLAFNVLCLSFLLDFLGIKVNILNVGNYFLSLLGIYNNFLGTCIGCIVILYPNYLLIFKGNKIEFLIEKYPNYNGKLFILYWLVSTFVPLLIINYLVFTR